MDSFATWVLRGLSETQGKSRLSQVSDLIDWSPIRRILDEMYDNKSEKGGRPNCDVILMFKILILQQWYGLNDLEVERQMADRISFMSFLGFPNPFPDSRTIWLFRERMANTGKEEVVWAELQRQLDAKGLQVKRGTIQDATFIEADPGKSKKTSDRVAKTRYSRDGTWTKKGKKAILAISSIKKATSITALFAKLRPPRQRYMTAGLICQSKEKSSSEIEDILACLLEVMTLPWCVGQLMRLWESLIKKGTG